MTTPRKKVQDVQLGELLAGTRYASMHKNGRHRVVLLVRGRIVLEIRALNGAVMAEGGSWDCTEAKFEQAWRTYREMTGQPYTDAKGNKMPGLRVE